MTVKQLRDWLIKQDETAVIRTRPYGSSDDNFTEDFFIRASSTIFSNREEA